MSPFSLTDQSHELKAVGDLYVALLKRWNARDAAGFAALFHPGGSIVGFDGSPVDGVPAIAGHLRDVFAHHATAA